jgi:hypothetical protein
VREAGLAPAPILLDLPCHDGAPVRRADRLEAARRAGKRADHEVPAGVRRDEGAPIHHAAVAERPRQHSEEREGGRRGRAREPPQVSPKALARALRGEEEEGGREEDARRPHERREPEDDPRDRPGAERSLPVPDEQPRCQEDAKARERLGHQQGCIRDQAGVRCGERAGDPSARLGGDEACQSVHEDGRERPHNGVDDGPDVGPGAEEPVKEPQKSAVSNGVVAPWMPDCDSPDHGVIRIPEPLRDPPRAEVVIVPIPDRLPRPGERHVEPGQERQQKQRRREPQDHGPGSTKSIAEPPSSPPQGPRSPP